MAGGKTLSSVTIHGGSGADAREIELQKSDTAIQWRYKGDAEWTDLVLLEDISGPQGEPGVTDEQIKQIQQNKDDITSLAEGKIDKPTEPPTAGKILKIKSVNEDGTFICEWADSESNLDVRIDGQSIVKNGVAEIPFHKNISTRNLYGVVCMGIAGDISAYRNSTGEIGYRYLPLNQIDLAVKTAMCDGKGAAWTESEKTGAWSRQNTIKTEMDDIAIAGAEYYLGELTELAITLPDDALAGQEITIVWYNGTEPANLSIDGNVLDFDYAPSANTRTELSCLWDGTYWRLISNEQSIPTTEVTEDA